MDFTPEQAAEAAKGPALIWRLRSSTPRRWPWG